MYIYIYIYIYIYNEREIPLPEDGNLSAAALERCSGVSRGQREHKGSFRGYPKQGGGAVFSSLSSLESGQSSPLSYPP